METGNTLEKLIITAGVVVVENSKILLVKRGSETKAFPNAWTFPGGKLEAGESLNECARRECMEEAGVEATGVIPYLFCEHVERAQELFPTYFIKK